MEKTIGEEDGNEGREGGWMNISGRREQGSERRKEGRERRRKKGSMGGKGRKKLRGEGKRAGMWTETHFRMNRGRE